MCGFLIAKGNFNKDFFLRNAELLKSRGPDDNHYIFDRSNNTHFSHFRLAILDLENGSQPLEDHSGQYIILFNGLIYNYKELKKILVNNGCKFRNRNCDTEILLESYKFWGERCLEKLDGMFAFAILNKKKQTLFCARDRFGEKPLYYKLSDNEFFISSNLKSIQHFHRDQVNKLSLAKYFYYGYIPSPNTLYKTIFKVEPGSFLEISIPENKIIKKNFYYEFNLNKKKTINKNYEIELCNLLQKSILNRSVTDSSIGYFLSGGLDSSIIAYLASNKNVISTFSMGFKNKDFDETFFSDLMSKRINSNHHSFINSTENIFDDLSILRKNDELIADSSLIPTSKLCLETSKFVKSVVSGDGSDEIFHGYSIFKANFLAKLIKSFFSNTSILKINNFLKKNISYSNKYMSFDFKIKKLLDGIIFKNTEWISEWMSYQEVNNINKLLSTNFSREEILEESNKIFNAEKLEQFTFNELVTEYFVKMYFSNNILTKIDRSSMAYGLEARVVFTDLDLFNFSINLPENLKSSFFNSKIILKNIFHKNLPKKIVNRKKTGFSYPIIDGLQNLYINNYFKDFDFVNPDFMKNSVDLHFNKKIDQKMFLWSYVNFSEHIKN
jgi:asparagine synthase (glutamine-hydrolysing)